MSEQPPSGEAVGRQDDFRRLRDLPHYYQCLGQACREAGLLMEFYWVLEAGFDYGQALKVLRTDLKQAESVDDVDRFLEKFGIPSEYED